MTPPPLPPNPALRVRLDYIVSEALGGSRFYVLFTGTRPSGAVCTTIAGLISTAWADWIKPMVGGANALKEVDVLDITDDLGAFGIDSTEVIGSRAGETVPNQVAANTEFDLGRRYRGGKPRIFWPAGVYADEADDSHWTSGFVTEMNAASVGFFAQVSAISTGGTILSSHVNLSYYRGFTNIENTSGRMRAAPTYRAVALQDVVTGYATKTVLGSQRRRRTATTP